MKKIFFIYMLFFIILNIKAQTNPLHQYTQNANAWLMYFGDHKVADKWGIHLEAQLRRNVLFSNPQQLLLRTGINYHIDNQIMATIGYCFVETYPYGAFPVKVKYPENRIWEQIQIKTQISNFEWVSRFRLEQRLSNLPVLNTSTNVFEPGDENYTNRFRLLNRFSIPFKGKKIEDKSFYLSAYDEFFINFGKNVASNLFDQNRAYIALGYKFPNVGRFEIGYLYQTIQKPDGIKIEQNNTLQIGLSSTINFYKSKK